MANGYWIRYRAARVNNWVRRQVPKPVVKATIPHALQPQPVAIKPSVKASTAGTRPIENIQAMWDSMQILRGQARIDAAADYIIKNRARYESVEVVTGVPWMLTAALHQEEASGNFAKGLHCGQRWDRVTTLVPKGRGPFKSWEDAAVDALTMNPERLAAVKRFGGWNPATMCWYAEGYNGWGYYHKGLVSSYVWAWTNSHKAGRYIADGVYSPTAIPGNPGAAPIMKTIMGKIGGGNQ